MGGIGGIGIRGIKGVEGIKGMGGGGGVLPRKGDKASWHLHHSRGITVVTEQ